MKIQITEEIRKEIEAGVKEAEQNIMEEMAVSFDLRNTERIMKNADYIGRMARAVKIGFLD